MSSFECYGKPRIYLKTRAGATEGHLWLWQSLGGGKRLEHYTGLRLEKRHYNAGYWRSGSKRPVRGGARSGSLGNLATTIASLRAFAAHRGMGTLSFADIGMDFYSAYRDWSMTARGHRASTFATRGRDIKSLMNEDLEDGAHDGTAHRWRLR